MSAVIAVLNRTGGAGKTSVIKDLGHAMAERGVRLLQVGLDPQSSLEVLAGLGFDTPPDRTVTRLLMPDEFRDVGALDTVVHDTPWGIQLVPASKALATAERGLGEVGRGRDPATQARPGAARGGRALGRLGTTSKRAVFAGVVACASDGAMRQHDATSRLGVGRLRRNGYSASARIATL